ncbi:DUF6214 family protein [Streptomyces sp. bgisy022]|uniref:DUF6214 family protein n=1 Tax=Streptomyces sp. bgisy022 TaxID=3413769 RepID=UPI003D706B78
MSVWPAWAVREGERATRWFHVRLAFTDGARVEGLVTVSEDGMGVEDLRARPALSPDDLAAFADWIEEPLARACGAVAQPPGGSGGGAHRRRAAPPRGTEGRRLAAHEYRAAQREGADPVLAVMGATGHSRRGALRLIGRARDAGLLTPRHARR